MGSIIVSGLAILADSDESNGIRAELYEKYHLDDYFRELAKNGISTWNPGRLWPGSLGFDMNTNPIEFLFSENSINREQFAESLPLWLSGRASVS